jgi:hypothetical protein
MENLINWGELSRLLCGTRSVLLRKRVGKKHEKAVEALLALLNKWYEEYVIRGTEADTASRGDRV